MNLLQVATLGVDKFVSILPTKLKKFFHERRAKISSTPFLFIRWLNALRLKTLRTKKIKLLVYHWKLLLLHLDWYLSFHLLQLMIQILKERLNKPMIQMWKFNLNSDKTVMIVINLIKIVPINLKKAKTGRK